MNIDVPDVEAPRVCWKQTPSTMSRCTFLAGHEGKHSWEQPRRSEYTIAVEWDANKTTPGHQLRYFVEVPA